MILIHSTWKLALQVHIGWLWAGTKMAYPLLSVEQKPRINMPGLECCLLGIEMDIFRHLFIYDHFYGLEGLGMCLLSTPADLGLFCGKRREGQLTGANKGCNYAILTLKL